MNGIRFVFSKQIAANNAVVDIKYPKLEISIDLTSQSLKISDNDTRKEAEYQKAADRPLFKVIIFY